MKTIIVWVLLLLVALSSWSIWKYQGTGTGKIKFVKVTTNSPEAPFVLLSGFALL
jgi:hypothetical protein